MESNTNTRGIPPRPSRPPIGRARPDTISLARPPQLGPMTDWRRDNFLVSNPYAPNEDNIDATLSSSSFSSLSPQHIEEVAETSPLAVQLSLDPQLMTLLLNVVESLQPNPVQEEQAEQSTPPQASQASRPFQDGLSLRTGGHISAVVGLAGLGLIAIYAFYGFGTL